MFIEKLSLLENACDFHIKNNTYEVDDKCFFRKYVYNSALLTDFHKSLTDVASRISGHPLMPSYNFISMYGKDGMCPAHFDRPQCEYTLDIQISCDVNWPIYVKNTEYILENGDALFYSGTNHFHYRRKCPTNMTHCHMVFFHFVNINFKGDLR
jgi:hypothetical protein